MNIGITGISMVALLVALAISTQANAENAPPATGSHPMLKADIDQDGRISRAEANASRIEGFTALDEDGDGVVSRDVFVSKTTDKIMSRMSRERIEARIRKRFGRYDLDGDKVLSLEEVTTRGQNRFDRMDRDRDGFLSGNEVPRRGGRRDHTGTSGGRSGFGSGGFGRGFSASPPPRR